MTSTKLVTINQKSGLSSDGDQSQAITIVDTIIQHSSPYKTLVSIANSAITFNPQSLSDIIISIDAGMAGLETETVDFSIAIDINLKNELNNHSQEYFEDIVVVDFYPHFHKLDQYFALKSIQQTIQPKVDQIIGRLNRQIIALQAGDKFEAVLVKLTNKLIDEKHDDLKDKEDQILLVLYYFYCNCCIGKKTKEEKNAPT